MLQRFKFQTKYFVKIKNFIKIWSTLFFKKIINFNKIKRIKIYFLQNFTS